MCSAARISLDCFAPLPQKNQTSRRQSSDQKHDRSYPLLTRLPAMIRDDDFYLRVPITRFMIPLPTLCSIGSKPCPKGSRLSSLHLVKIPTPPAQTRKEDVLQDAGITPKDFKKPPAPSPSLEGWNHLHSWWGSTKTIVLTTTAIQSDSQLL